jgi:two-component system sensor histidine kinase ChvG
MTAGGRWARFASRIAVRLLAVNALVLFLPIAALVYFDRYELRLLELQEQDMAQQGRVLAAALAGSAVLDPGESMAVLGRLERQTTARLRVVDRFGEVLADTAAFGPRRAADLAEQASGSATNTAPDASRLYRLGAAPFRWIRRAIEPDLMPAGEAEANAQGDATADRIAERPEVRAALSGRYGAATRSDAGLVFLHAAVPVRMGNEVAGAVIVSRSTQRVQADLYAVRLLMFRVFLGSLATAAVLALLLAATIERPLRKLGAEAATLVDVRGRLRGAFTSSRRRDEIGDLGRALHGLASRLHAQQELADRFVQDLSHELKNPLATVRSTIEVLPETTDPAARRELSELSLRAVARMEQMLGQLTDLSGIEAGVDSDERAEVDLVGVVREVAEAWSTRAQVQLDLPSVELRVSAVPEQLAQVADNLLANAASFSPAGCPIELRLAARDGRARLLVRDHGRGLAAGEAALVFRRFYTRREPGGPRHLGLGLSIVRAIVESHGGEVSAGNAPGGGALFTVELPLV